jgi:hypothetical protein
MKLILPASGVAVKQHLLMEMSSEAWRVSVKYNSFKHDAYSVYGKYTDRSSTETSKVQHHIDDILKLTKGAYGVHTDTSTYGTHTTPSLSRITIIPSCPGSSNSISTLISTSSNQ